MSKIDCSDEVHDALKDHCQQRDLRMKDVVERLIRAELEPKPDIRIVVNTNVLPPTREQVKAAMRAMRSQVTRRSVPPPADMRDPWTRQPFWKDPGYAPPAPRAVQPRNRNTEDFNALD